MDIKRQLIRLRAAVICQALNDYVYFKNRPKYYICPKCFRKLKGFSTDTRPKRIRRRTHCPDCKEKLQDIRANAMWFLLKECHKPYERERIYWVLTAIDNGMLDGVLFSCAADHTLDKLSKALESI